MKSNAISLNMSVVKNNDKYDGGIHLTTSDGVDITSEQSAKSFDELIDSIAADILCGLIEKDTCDDCEYFEECRLDDENEDELDVEDYLEQQELEEIPKEQFMIEGLQKENESLRNQINALQKRFEEFEKSNAKAKSYNSSLNADIDIWEKYLKSLLKH